MDNLESGKIILEWLIRKGIEMSKDVQLKISKVCQENEEETQQLILTGLRERFGFIDDTLNSDLYPISKTYMGKKNILFVGYHKGNLICTGALVKENEQTGRITRMSVAKECRGKGFAKTMLEKLEEKAEQTGYSKLVLETNHDWTDAIYLYKKAGYAKDYKDETSVHMYKNLHSAERES